MRVEVWRSNKESADLDQVRAIQVQLASSQAAGQAAALVNIAVVARSLLQGRIGAVWQAMWLKYRKETRAMQITATLKLDGDFHTFTGSTRLQDAMLQSFANTLRLPKSIVFLKDCRAGSIVAHIFIDVDNKRLDRVVDIDVLIQAIKALPGKKVGSYTCVEAAAKAVQVKVSESAAVDQMNQMKLQSAGIRNMRAIMVRVAKGTMAMRVEVWRLTLTLTLTLP
jgi:hypothetical protein